MGARRTVLAILFLLFSSRALGAEFDLGIGPSLINFNYAEAPPVGKSTETATYASFSAVLQAYFTPMVFLQARYDGMNGVRSQYVGTDLNTNAAVFSVNNLSFQNEEVDLFFPIYFDEVEFYVGYGARTWNRFLTGSPGYGEAYSWNYMPVGFRWMFAEVAQAEVGLDISARPTSNGIIKVNTTFTYGSQGTDSQMTLGNKTGYRIAFPLRYKAVDRWELWASPWYEHSEIGASNTVRNDTFANPVNSRATYIYEPDSKTDQYGLDFMIAYRF